MVIRQKGSVVMTKREAGAKIPAATNAALGDEVVQLDNNLPAYYFHQGTNDRAYDYMGVHAERIKTGWRYTFRVWAYRARAVELAGDFNGWGGTPMTRITEGGIWETSVESEHTLVGCPLQIPRDFRCRNSSQGRPLCQGG